jgi:GntR family transcriptional regulator
MPDRELPTPLWNQVSEDLRRRISAGEFPEAFPGEISLTEQYEVSRHTIREALRVLRAEGLVRSERGRISTVETTTYTQSLGSLYSLFRTLDEQGTPQHSIVRRQSTTINRTVATALGQDPDAELVVIERVRCADGTPLALDTAWLPCVFAGPLLNADLASQGLYASLTETCGVTVDSGEEQVTAITPPTHVAKLLEMPKGGAVHYIERIAYADDIPMEWRETYIRGDRFSLQVEWSRTSSSLAGSTPITSKEY